MTDPPISIPSSNSSVSGTFPRILMAAAEAVPLAKTGGLADVIGSLPAALRARGADVRVVLPHYSSIDAGRFPLQTLAAVRVPFDGGHIEAQLQQVVSSDDGPGAVPLYLIEAPRFFRRPQLYGYDDDVLRFGFWSRACLELPRVLDWKPDIIHCHDWHAGLLPLYLRLLQEQEEDGVPPSLRGVKTLFTIHNLAYQGLAPKEMMPRLGLPWRLFNLRELEYFDRINALKGGLVFADALTAVSPRYAREIQTAEHGEGLEGVLQERVRQRPAALTGILNGLDYARWNPRRDPYIAAPYGLPFEAGDKSAKALCKRELLRRIALPGGRESDSPHVPVVGMVSRLSSQKGFDLVAQSLPQMLSMGCCFVLLGTGDERYLRQFEQLGRRFGRTASMNLGRFNEELAHHIYAGSDFFLMPSRYEPCGLSQMIALAYGTVPIVRATGGLADTVTEFDPSSGTGNGFVFEEFTASALTEAVRRALACYRSPQWDTLRRNALRCDFSWDASAARYLQLYNGMSDGL